MVVSDLIRPEVVPPSCVSEGFEKTALEKNHDISSGEDEDGTRGLYLFHQSSRFADISRACGVMSASK